MKFDSNNAYKKQVAISYFRDLIKKKAWIEINELKVPNTISFRRLEWVWLTAIEKQTGHDKNELHYLYRALFLQRDRDLIESSLKPDTIKAIDKYVYGFCYFNELPQFVNLVSKSTSELSDAEYIKYLKEIQKHARVKFGVILLNLKDKAFADFYREYGFI